MFERIPSLPNPTLHSLHSHDDIRYYSNHQFLLFLSSTLLLCSCPSSCTNMIMVSLHCHHIFVLYLQTLNTEHCYETFIVLPSPFCLLSEQLLCCSPLLSDFIPGFCPAVLSSLERPKESFQCRFQCSQNHHAREHWVDQIFCSPRKYF